MLSPKERLFKVLAHEPVDRTPCICPGGMMNMVTSELVDLVGASFQEAHLSAEKMASLAAAVYEKGCFENYGVPFCMTIESEDFGAKVDYGSDIYEPHVIDYALDSVSAWQKLPPIRLDGGRDKVVLDAISLLKAKETEVPIIGNLTGPVSTAGSILEPVVMYKEFRKNNEDAHRLMSFITDQLIAFAKAQIQAGADIIAISDPSGTGEILGPKFFEEFVVTYVNRIVDAVKAEGVAVIVHICGQMKNVYKEVDQIRADVLSFDAVVNLKEAREELPKRLLMGNVSTYTIEFGDSAKVGQLTQKCVQDGADIVAPACGLGMKSPLSNVRAMIKAVEKGGPCHA